MAPVTVIRLKHLNRFKDRHGKIRHYLRVPGCKPAALAGEPGSPEFMASYHAAVAAAAPTKPAAPRLPPGSLDALAVSLYGSADWGALRASSQANYRRIIERLRAGHGDKPVARLDARGVRALMAERQAHPTAANHLLRVLRMLMRHAIDQGICDTDPTFGVRRHKVRVKGFSAWTEADIAAYEARWPSGTRQRLAMALLLYTGQRRSDVVRMGRQHVTGRRIAVRQVKTGAALSIPIHAALAVELLAAPADRLTFLATEAGPGFTPNGFYMRFMEWCREAGIETGRSPHGLRKACGRRLTEAGCTPHEIGSILGHRTLSEMQKYTESAGQELMADRAMTRLGRAKPRT